jgi:ketosteroid isomerase-like protein
MTGPEAESQTTNLRVAQRYATAWKAGDRATIADCYHGDFTLHYFGQNPFAGDHVGKQAALTTLAKFSAQTNRKLMSIVDVMAGPERATIIARESFERDGQRTEFERVLVYTIKDERFRECWVYDGDRAAVDMFLNAAPRG